MATALKDQFGLSVVREVARMVSVVCTRFDGAAFEREVRRGFAELSLTERGRHISNCLHSSLNMSYPHAINVLLAAVAQPHGLRAQHGMTTFLYMPFVFYVADYGMGHFDESMHAQYVLTQLFTAEFSVRPFLEKYPQQTLAVLKKWASDSNVHVRRLVSEGTRPRLPWAVRLPQFQRDPRPVLELLELLKDDPELYVRRSVANNLNDIGKDHPDVLATVAQRWLRDASAERQWIVRHALRSAIKRGEAGALHALGYSGKPDIRIAGPRISPARVCIGDAVQICFELVATGASRQSLMVDLLVHYVKASGATSKKVFKLKAVSLARGDSAHFAHTLSLRQLSTRRHYAGKHRVQAQINGCAYDLGSFTLQTPA